MSENIVLDKSYKFALRIVKLFIYLTDENKEFVLSKALLTAGTNVGAHVKAAQEAESKPDFYHEMNMALKNASKTAYWLQLLRDGEFLDEKQFDSIHKDCEELIRLTKSITRPTRQQPEN